MARNTGQEDAVKDDMRQARRPLTPPEVLERASVVVPSLGIATVYRHLKTLQEEGWLKCVDLPGEGTRYELASIGHHHHFKCDTCERVFDVPGCTSDVDELAPEGFVVTRHEVLLFGLCSECAVGQ